MSAQASVQVSAVSFVWSIPRSTIERRAARRRRRYLARRVATASVALVLCLGMSLQQTRAADWLLNGIPRIPDYVSFWPTAGEQVQEFGRKALGLFASVLTWRAGGGAPESVTPAEPTGAPWPWQAADAVAPFTVVNLASGNLYTAVPIVAGEDVSFALYHNSIEDTGISTLSTGWSHSYSAYLDFDTANDKITYVADDGAKVVFSDDTFDSPVVNLTYRLTLRPASGSDWEIVDAAQNVMVFDWTGQLKAVRDASSNATTLTYESGKLTTITDPVERVLTLEYDGTTGKLIEVHAPALQTGEPRDFELDYDTNGNLEKIWSPRHDDQGELMYHMLLGYTSSKLTSISDYEGNTSTFEYYSSGGKFKKVTHPEVYDYVADDDVAAFRVYSYVNSTGGAYRVDVLDERGNTSMYDFDNGGRLTKVRDQLNRTVSELTWGTNNRLATSKNVLGGVTKITYDSNGNPTLTKTPRGDIATEFDSLNRLTEITDPVGNVTQYLYEDEDNPTRITRMGSPTETTGNEVLFEWGPLGVDHRGKITKMTDPNGVEQEFTYQARNKEKDLQNEEEEDPECPETRMTYDRTSTGEVTTAGTEEVGCPPDALPILTCDEYDAVSCSVCGCDTSYNEDGTVSDKTRDFNCGEESSAASSCGPPDSYHCAFPVESGCYCGGVDEQFQYDGNGRLTCAFDYRYPEEAGSYSVMHDVMTYDARGRLSAFERIGCEEQYLEQPTPYAHVWVFPTYNTLHEYADSSGQ